MAGRAGRSGQVVQEVPEGLIMYTVRFGVNWKYSVQAPDRATAVHVAEALSFKGWKGIHVLDPDGHTVPWKYA